MYEDEDFESIVSFMRENIIEYADRKQERIWMPLIGFYHGFRLEEIAQMHVSDIYKDKEGIWVFDINEILPEDTIEVKNVKNDPSERVVPIHPKLIEFGLIKYYEGVKKSGEIRLFPYLNKGRDGYGRNLGDSCRLKNFYWEF